MKIQHLSFSVFLSAAIFCGAVFAQATAPVAVDGSWARATFAGQKTSGAFMRLTAPTATRLVRVETPAARVAEIHEMKMDGDIMKMRAVPALDLPAGQTVELKPGGYHVMLMGLEAPLVQGEKMPLTLVFRNAQGAEHLQQVQVPVAAGALGAQPQ